MCLQTASICFRWQWRTNTYLQDKHSRNSSGSCFVGKAEQQRLPKNSRGHPESNGSNLWASWQGYIKVAAGVRGFGLLCWMVFVVFRLMWCRMDPSALTFISLRLSWVFSIKFYFDDGSRSGARCPNELLMWINLVTYNQKHIRSIAFGRYYTRVIHHWGVSSSAPIICRFLILTVTLTWVPQFRSLSISMAGEVIRVELRIQLFYHGKRFARDKTRYLDEWFTARLDYILLWLTFEIYCQGACGGVFHFLL